jgi:SEC-C motif-containing protein
MSPNAPCPCGSGSKYKRCCRPLHRGAVADTPLTLMRSRYTAYALGLADYILQTTHPDGEHFREDTAALRDSVQAFSTSTQFLGLEILEAGEDHVTFRARLEQGGRDATFVERSTFAKSNDRWAYLSGEPER